MLLTEEGQIKKGDMLSIVGHSDLDTQLITAKHVIDVDGKEEVIINELKNYYFATNMVVSGKSWAKSILIIK